MKQEEYRVELFVFPDGTQVEMIIFAADDRRRGAPSRAAAAVSAPRADARKTAPSGCCVPPPPPKEAAPYTCPVCGSGLVYPMDWERSGDAAWTLQLRCPECETRREVILGRASVEQFNRELYQGAQAVAREADRLTRRNFEEEIEWIVAALARDLIQPMDF